MKLAWICYDHHNTPLILFVKPERYMYRVIIPIVYTEIQEHDSDR